jgi:hypothetical protein
MQSEEDKKAGTETDPSESAPGGALRGLWKWTQRILLAFFGLLIALYLLFQIPAIQNWSVQQITQSLSNRLDTEVSIDYFRLGFFNKLALQGVYIEDLNRDTLLVAENLTASIDLNPLTVISKGLVINQLDLQQARLYIRRAPDSPEDNLKLLLKLLSNKPENSQRDGGFDMDLSRLNLDRVAFIKLDRYKGQKLQIELEEGLVQLQTLSIPNALIDADYVRLTRPRILIDDYERSPFFPDSLLNKSADSSQLSVAIGELDLREGVFELHNYRKEPVKLTTDDILNYRHLEIFDINMRIRRFRFVDDIFSGNINTLTAKDSSGFVLDQFSVDDATVSRDGFRLNGLSIETPYSNVGDTLVFRYDGYHSFRDFENSVIMEGRFNNTDVMLGDIMTFAPGLYENTFFRNNENKNLLLDGIIRGTVNNLSGRDLNVQLADGTALRGRFSSRNLAVKNSESMNLRLEDLRTNMQTLRELVPDFNPPDNFNRLGNLRFNGSFDGFFADFVAFGYLRTDIGEAEMDMQMNLFEGRERAQYRGTLNLRDFDLGVWTGDPEFGQITFSSQVLNGRGITGNTVRADLLANVDVLEYKGYRYENASLSGQLQTRQFDGNFAIQDDNIDFTFSGQVNLAEGVPYFNFEASVNRLDLQQLNLSEDYLILSGDVDLNLRNQRIADLAGSINVRQFNIRTPDTLYQVEYANLNSWVDSSALKHLTIDSDVAVGNMEGQFRLDRIPATVVQFLNATYPEFSRELGIVQRDTLEKTAFFTYEINIVDSKGLNRLIDHKLGDLRDIHFSGKLDERNQNLQATLSVPSFRYDNLFSEEIFWSMDSEGAEGEIDFSVEKILINDRTEFAPITLISFLDRDSLIFSLNYDDADRTAFLGNLELDGTLSVVDSNSLQLRLDNSKLVIVETPWQIDQNNVIAFVKDSVIVKNFVTRSRDRVVRLSSFGRRGLEIRADNLDLSQINDIIHYDPTRFAGHIDLTVKTQDVFDLQNLEASAQSDSLFINGDDWGLFRLDARAPDPKSPLYTYVSMTQDERQLLLEGFYNLDATGTSISGQKGYFDASLDIMGYPLAIAEYFIGNTISETTGTFDAGLRFYGSPEKPNVVGNVDMGAGGLNVNFLKTRYSWRGADVSVNNYLFDLTGTVLYDKYGHDATISGGIRHNQLKDFGFNARLTTDRFLALDTKKGDNNLFYGQAIGDGEVLFTGTFKQPDVYVEATVSDSTNIVIPVSQEREASELSFLRFVDKDKPEEEEGSLSFRDRLPDLKGVSLEMDLQATEEAELQIIFNEQAGDIIEGQGRGALRISVPRSGPFQMFGTYTIVQGDYLFTLYNLINKKFTVQRGGTITWTGDPFEAEIDLVARYTDLNTSVANFIQEYLISAPADLRNQASNSTDVDLTMNLEGPLLQPEINFDIAFPNLRQELQSYTETKLRVLKQDQNELNKQVFGLIVAGQFLPSEFALQGTEVIYNTVSEFVSNQLSLLLTELFSEFIGEGEVISGIDFDIAYNQYQQVDLGDGQNFNRGDELEVSLKQDFFNDRFSIEVGGAFGVNGNVRTASTTSGAFVGNDLVFTYILNQDRSLKLQVYQRLEPDIAGRKLQIGTGLSFQKEFNSFGEFLRGAKNAGK